MTQRPASDPENRVVDIRSNRKFQQAHANNPAPAGNLEQFERSKDVPDDFRHRMVTNTLAFAFIALLIAGAVWLAEFDADHAQEAGLCTLRQTRLRADRSPGLDSLADRFQLSHPVLARHPTYAGATGHGKMHCADRSCDHSTFFSEIADSKRAKLPIALLRTRARNDRVHATADGKNHIAESRE